MSSCIVRITLHNDVRCWNETLVDGGTMETIHDAKIGGVANSYASSRELGLSDAEAEQQARTAGSECGCDTAQIEAGLERGRIWAAADGCGQSVISDLEDDDFGDLLDYHTGNRMRAATREQRDASREAAKYDGGAGVIIVAEDWHVVCNDEPRKLSDKLVRCYVQE